MGICLFCESECGFRDFGFNQEYFCNTCGRYFLTLTTRHLIQGLGKNLTRQNKLNIAYQNLKNKIETPMKKLFWIGTGETKAFEESNVGSEDKYLEFEEFLNQEVDHAEKPFVLLDVVGAKLKDSLDRCAITKMDMILTKISSDEELGQLLTLFMEKGFFSPSATYPSFNQGRGGVGRSIGKTSVGLTLEGWALFGERKRKKAEKLKKEATELKSQVETVTKNDVLTEKQKVENGEKTNAESLFRVYLKTVFPLLGLWLTLIIISQDFQKYDIVKFYIGVGFLLLSFLTACFFIKKMNLDKPKIHLFFLAFVFLVLLFGSFYFKSLGKV